jgi:hypothetical protein
VVPRSGRPRRGPAVQRPGRQQSDRLTSGRQRSDRHRAGHLTSGRRWDDRRRTNHGRQGGQFVRRRRPGRRRMRNAQPAGAAGRHLRPDGRNGARALPRAGHHRAGHRSGACRRGNHRCADRPRGDSPHEGRQYVDHRTGNRPPAGCRQGHGREKGGRCSHQRSRATLPGRPGRCRCGTNLACSPVSRRTGGPGPGDCHSSCFHPCCHAGQRLGPDPLRCLNSGPARQAHRYPICWPQTRWPQVRWPARRRTYWAAGTGCQRRRSERCCFRRHRTGPHLHGWGVPDRPRPCGPGQHRCWNGPDHGTHPPNGSGPAPRHHYGPGRPDPARLPRSCSTLS